MADSVSRERGAAGSPAGGAAGSGEQAGVFISYARRDAKDVAQRLKADLEAERWPDGRPRFRVWLDTSELRGGPEWDRTIRAALQQSRVVVAVLSVASVRGDAAEPDSVCLDELAVARFQTPPSRIVPVMWLPVEPPLIVYRFHHIDMTASHPPGGDDYLAKYRELVGSIDHILTHGTERVRGVVENLKPLDFDSYIATRLEGFTGRGWVFDEIGEWRSRSEEGVSRLLLLTGPPGIGKSAIVAQLAHRNPGGQVLASFFCDARNPDTLRPESFVRTVAAQAAARIPEYAAALNAGLLERELSEERFAQADGAAVAFRQGVLDPLAHVPPPADGSTRYLLVDGLDEAPPGGVTITRLLADNLRRFPSWLRVVATSRPVADITRDLGAAARVPLEAGDARNRDDVAAYILRRLEGGGELACDLRRAGLSAPAAADALCDRADGNFLYAQHVLDDIVTHRGEGCSLARLDRLPSGLPGLYHQFFSRTFGDSAGYDAKLRPLLEALVAARGPLPDALLAPSVDLDEEEDLPRALRPLLQYLDKPDSGHRFHHRSLGEWLVTADAGDFQVSLRKGHGRLAGAGWAEYGKGGAESLAGYWLLHLPAHLEGAKRHDDAAALQRDVDFLLGGGLLLWEQGDAAEALERLRRLATVVSAEGFAADLESGELELASLNAMAAGGALARLGDSTHALMAFEADLSIALRLTQLDKSNVGLQHNLSVSWNNVGELRKTRGDQTGAEAAYDACHAIMLGLAEHDASNTDHQAMLATSWRNIGDIRESKGILAGAQDAYETALAIVSRLTEQDPSNADLQHDLSSTWCSVIGIREARGDLAGAEEALVAGRNILLRLTDQDPSHEGIQCDLATSWCRLGLICQARGDHASAREAFEADLAIMQRLTQQDPGHVDWQRDLSVAWNKVGYIRQALGDLAGAQEALEASLAIRQRLTKQDPSHAGRQSDLSVSWINVGGMRRARGDLVGAQEAYEASLAIMQRLTEQDPSHAGWQRELSVSWIGVGDTCQALGDFVGAQEAYEAGLAIMQGLTQQDPSHAGWQRDLSVSWSNVGGMRRARGDLAGAQEACEAVLAIVQRLTQQDPSNAEWQRDLSVSWNNVGDIRCALGDLTGAQEAFEAGLDIMRRLTRQDPSHAGWQRGLSVSWSHVGGVREALGDLSGALAAFEAWLVIVQRLTQQDPSNADWQHDLSVSWNHVGGIRQAQGDLAGAQEAFEAGLAIMQRLTEQDSYHMGWQRDLSVSWNRVGDIRQAHGDLAGAQEAYEAGLAIMQRLTRQDPSHAGWRNDLAWSHVRLARIMDEMSREEDAAAHWREAHRLLSEMRAKGEHLGEDRLRELGDLDARFGRGGVDPDTPPDAD